MRYRSIGIGPVSTISALPSMYAHIGPLFYVLPVYIGTCTWPIPTNGHIHTPALPPHFCIKGIEQLGTVLYGMVPVVPVPYLLLTSYPDSGGIRYDRDVR